MIAVILQLENQHTHTHIVHLRWKLYANSAFGQCADPLTSVGYLFEGLVSTNNTSLKRHRVKRQEPCYDDSQGKIALPKALRVSFSLVGSVLEF